MTTPTEPTVQVRAQSPAKQAFFRILSWMGNIVLALLPAWCWFVIPEYGYQVVGLIMILAAFFRLCHRPGLVDAVLSIAAVVLAIPTIFLQQELCVRVWPVLLLVLLVGALFVGIGNDRGFVCARFSESYGPLDATGRAYCRVLSIVWMGFLIVCTLVAALTAFWGNLRSWSMWNGCIFWVIGLIFYGSERLARKFILADLKRQAAAKKIH